MTTTLKRDVDQRYLSLLKEVLTDYIRVDNPDASAMPLRYVRASSSFKRARNSALSAFARIWGLELVKPSRVNAEKRRELRANGLDWPPLAETMVGLKRLDHLQGLVETILAENIPGDLLEAGVWRGGASIFMQAVLTVNNARDRAIWLCDSFEGLPPPDPKYPADAGLDFHKHSILAVSVDDVRRNFERYDMLGDNLRFVKGYFEDTLAEAPVDQIALLRMDGDMYSSTTSILNALYDKVSTGGFVVVDDYNIEACVKAVTDFRDTCGVTDPIMPIDGAAVFWRKSE